MGGGGFAELKRLFLKLQNLLHNFQKQKFYRLESFQDFHSKFFQNSSHGTILIEFAFCVPVMIILLLFINDIMILARTKDEMKRSAYCAVQLIQNVSKNRTNRFITKQDFKNIAKARLIVVPVAQKIMNLPIVTDYISLTTSMILVQGIGNDKCLVKYHIGCAIHQGDWNHDCSVTDKQGLQIAPGTSYYLNLYNGHLEKINEPVSSTALYPDFHIEKDQIKAVLEVTIAGPPNSATLRKLLGLHILNLPKYNSICKDWDIYFMDHIIFTPIYKIFDENNPPE